MSYLEKSGINMKGFNIHGFKLDNKMVLNNAKILQAVNKLRINN